MRNKVSIEEATAQLVNEENQILTTLMQYGSMSVEYYAPKKIDSQVSHVQDEIYVIVNGSGIFRRNEEEMNFKTGDVLFVPAGITHRFIEFTEDFSTWVIFYGPKCGEK